MTRSSLFVCSLALQWSLVMCSYGVIRMHSDDGSWKSHFCMMYNPSFRSLPEVADHAATYRLTDLSTTYGCNASDYATSTVNGTVNGTAVIVARSNCTFVTKATLAQAAGAKAILVASNELVIPGVVNDTDYSNINISIVTTLWSDVRSIQTKEHGSPVFTLLYSPAHTRFDLDIVLFFFLAIITIAVGGFWSGKAKYDKVMGHTGKVSDEPSTTVPTGAGAESEAADTDEDELDDSVDISLKIIIVFLVVACTFLVLMYFFYDYLIYVVLVLFAVAGAMGLYNCIQPWIWRKLVPWSTRIPTNRIPIFQRRPQYRNILLGLLCLGVGIFWFIVRHTSYAWIIQNFLGVMFCIHVLRTITIPNLKICTILLAFLFVYDVFFVFITPLLTKSGDSIMVKVATGGDTKTKEKIPMVFLSPKLSPNDLNICHLPYSVLGFGDAVVPGLLVAHNHAFDLFVGSTKVYYISTIIAYFVGLMFTYIALAVMETGQPALMYLVPCTLLTTFVIGCIRGEVCLLWRGVKESNKEATVESTNPRNGAGGNSNAVTVRTETESTGSRSSLNENRQLLNPVT